MILADALKPPLHRGQHGERLPSLLGEARQRLDEETRHMEVISKVRKPESLAAAQQGTKLLPQSARHVRLG
jgi:hypothetical protein